MNHEKKLEWMNTEKRWVKKPTLGIRIYMIQVYLYTMIGHRKC